MKMLWNVASFLAVVNMLAMVMFGAWLWQSGRLDRGRVHVIRDLLSPTIEEAARAEAIALSEQQNLQEQQMETARRISPGLPSSLQVNQLSALNTREQLTLRRLEDERNMLVEQLRLQSEQMRKDRQAFEEERTAWENATRADRERKADEQFRKAVELYAAIPPKQAKSMLVELVGQGAVGQAIAYLNAMDTRVAAKILRELKSDTENELATKLLEDLRTFGLTARGMKESGDVNHVDQFLSDADRSRP